MYLFTVGNGSSWSRPGTAKTTATVTPHSTDQTRHQPTRRNSRGSSTHLRATHSSDGPRHPETTQVSPGTAEAAWTIGAPPPSAKE